MVRDNMNGKICLLIKIGTRMNKTELEKEILQANIAYSSGIPFMTDEEYDLLWKSLYDIDPNNQLLYHTAQSHEPVFGKTWHKYPIYGTNKAFNMTDMRPFLTRFGSLDLIIEPKYDGCAAVLTKTNSGLTLTLEGDGRIGSDITRLLPYISIDFELRNFQAIEIILPWKDWNPEYGKNPRNVVAGWLARKHEAPGAMMEAIPHNFGPFKKAYRYSGDLLDMNNFLLDAHAEWSKLYPIDGIMIKVADEKQRLISGNNGTTNNWSIAWKPPIQIKETTVIDIEWNISRLGRVIPTVIYEPIELCGTTNSRVTGNNAQWIIDKGIYIGATTTIGKAGEIIPKIIEVKNPKTISLPTNCPTCNSFLDYEGVHLVCNGENCITKKIVSITYFYSHKGMKIDGIGESTIEKLLLNPECYKVLIDSPWVLLDPVAFNLSASIANTIGLLNFTNILTEVNNSNNTKNMAHFISALGLPQLSYKTALKLCNFLKSGKLEQNISFVARQSFTQGVILYGRAIGELKNFSFAKLPSPSKATYCITGTLSMSRDEMIEFLNPYGFEFSPNVNRELNYLIVGESPGKLKFDKAEKYNIPRISESQLMEILKEYANE